MVVYVHQGAETTGVAQATTVLYTMRGLHIEYSFQTVQTRIQGEGTVENTVLHPMK